MAQITYSSATGIKLLDIDFTGASVVELYDIVELSPAPVPLTAASEVAPDNIAYRFN
ncbi:hypothetical protein R1A27_25715 [Methylobacterium sp. NMS12]|uniref:hypothetical protein n=1 Tax=Methylobacterium sp. NMS12 TaxID=3079766 RepID=UPI003F8839F3